MRRGGACFFFSSRRRHTRFKCDWSSDVCSSDLSAALGAQAAAQSLGPFGSEFRPTNPDQLFVSNAHNAGVGTGTVSAFQDSAAGILSPIGISPFADHQTAPCCVYITHDGPFLLTVSTGSGTISAT